MSQDSPARDNPLNLVNRDREHLKLLCQFHYAVAIVQGLLLLVNVVIPLCMGPDASSMHVSTIGIVNHSNTIQTLSTTGLSMEYQQALLTNLFSRAILAFLLVMSGVCFKQHQYWWTGVSLAIIEVGAMVLFHDPTYGFLGLSGILVLRRESVRTLFKGTLHGKATKA